jgi:type II secretory pathway component GspD/PulD (secretin)
MGVEQASAATSFAAAAKSALSVTADVENNALLIQTTAREYERVERILRQLDVLPTQVLLEAVIAEVTLTDELKFGLRWFSRAEISRLACRMSQVGLSGRHFLDLPGVMRLTTSK